MSVALRVFSLIKRLVFKLFAEAGGRLVPGGLRGGAPQRMCVIDSDSVDSVRGQAFTQFVCLYMIVGPRHLSRKVNRVGSMNGGTRNSQTCHTSTSENPQTFETCFQKISGLFEAFA